MRIYAKNGTFDTEALYKQAQTNIMKLEDICRNEPKSSIKYPIGYVLPLGTLSNAPDQEAQFKSNFHIVAYMISPDLIDKELDFEDFNIGDRVQDLGQISKLSKELDSLSESTFGRGWRITVFNVKLTNVIESMCKGNNDLDNMRKSMKDLLAIINSRISNLAKATSENTWPHELIDLFYAPLTAISYDFVRTIGKCETKSIKISKMQDTIATSTAKTRLIQNKSSEGILIETLVYDDYASGIRLLTNVESFTSSKIRVHDELDPEIYLYVLKARIDGESPGFIPIRQFAGKSKISTHEILSGCTTRIVYNIINKNYSHWSFISIPKNLKLKLSTLRED